MTLWDWSLAAWARPGVEAAAVQAQDERGVSIALLLWLAYAGEIDERAGQAGATLAAEFEAQVLSPLRQARRALKTPVKGIAGMEELRSQVRQAELTAERRILEALQDVAGGDGDDQAAFRRLDQALGLAK